MKRRFVSLVFLVVLLVAQLPAFLFDFVPSVYATTATFGYDTAGTAGSTSIENAIVGSMFTCPSKGNVTNMGVYLTPASLYAKPVKTGIFLHSNLTLVGNSSAATVSGEEGWFDFAFSVEATLYAGLDYVLVVWGTSGTGTCKVSFDAGTTNQSHTATATYGTWPNPLVPTHGNNKYSIYCNYTVIPTAPTASDVGWTSNTYVNEPLNISAKWTGTTLDWCGFSWNASGSWSDNETVFNNDGGSVQWGNITKTLPATNGTVISIREYCNDSVGMGDTGIYNFTVTYGSWTKLEVADCDLDATIPVTWTQIANDINFTGGLPAWREYSTSVTIMWGRWIKFTNITTGDANHYLRGYEIQVYDANSSSYKTPSTIYSKCGETSTYVATNFIDGDNSTSWKHDVNELHEIVVDMGAYIKPSKFNFYDPRSYVSSQWSYVDVYTANPWAVVGLDPWINGTDYATNYVTTVTAEAVLGNFTFQQLSATYRSRITEIRLELNFTKNLAASQITAQWWNTTAWVNASFATGTTWTCMNVTLPIYFNEMRAEIGKVNGIKVRFVGNESSTFTIDYACLYVQGCLNLDNSERLWPCSYSGTESDWTTSGDSPYLDNNTGSHGHIVNIGDNVSWFNFDYYALATFQQVWLNIEANTLIINITIDNGVANYTYQLDLLFPVAWYSVNVTDALTTTTKLNSVRMKLTAASDFTLVPMTTLYRCYLRVYRIYSIADCNATTTGQPTTLSCHFMSTNGLSTYALNHNMSGSWLGTNITGTLSGNDDWGNYTFGITMSSADVFAFIYDANDSLGVWDFGEYVYKPIMWEGYTSEDLNLLSYDLPSSRGTFQHGLGRNSYYVPFPEGDTYWVIFANQTVPITEDSEMVYYASYDGKNWSASGTIRELQNETNPFTGGMMYGHYEQRGGVNYYHYQYCAEHYNASFWYRRGIFNYNLTITWSTPTEQLVFNGSLYRATEGEQLDNTFAINGIATSPSGHIWMFYYHYAIDSMDIVHCEVTNGTWVTAAGYPKTLFGAPYNASGWAFEGYVFATPDEENCYAVTIRGFTALSKVLGIALINGVPQTVENVSDLSVFEMRRFSGFAVDGNVHVVYLASNASLRYCFRNYTTSTWTIKDEFISDTLSDTKGIGRGQQGQGDPAEAGSVTYPVAGYNVAENTVFCNWADLDYESYWFDVRNSSGWIGKERLVLAPTDTYFLIDPNICPEWISNNAIFVMEATSKTSGMAGNKSVWVYKYELDVTFLAVGWTNFTVWTTDVGRTLEQICANIQFNIIDSTIIIKDNSTEYRYDYGLDPNATVLILVTTDELQIYCVTSGNWYHDYNNFYYCKNSTSQTVTVSLSAPRQIEVTKTVSQSLTPVLSAERLAEMVRSASQTIASALSMGRLVEWLKSVSQTISVNLVGSKLIEWIQAVTLLVGIGIAASRSTELFKSATQGLTLGLSMERLVELTKGVSQTVSVTLSGQRLIDVLRFASQTIALALQGIGERIALYLRDATLTLAISVQGSRLAEWIKTVSQPLSITLQSIRLSELWKAASQTISTALTGNRLIDVTRLANQSVGFSFGSSRLADFVRTASQGVNVDFAVASFADFFRTVSQALTATLNAQRLIEVSKQVSQIVTFSLQAIGEKVGIYLRNAALTVTLSLQGSRLAEWFKAATQSISFTFETGKVTQFVRSVSQAISAVLNGERMADLLRSASQTITLTLQTIGEKVGIYLRDAALTITTAFQGSRLAEWIKTTSQTISITLGSARLAEFIRSASQTIALAFSSVGEKLGNYFANVALTITTTLQNSRLADWTRQATQTLSLSLSTSRIAEFLALVTLTIMATVNADRLVLFARQASQTLSFIFNGERLIEVSRAASQTIALTLEGWGEFVGNYFRNAVLNMSFTMATLAEVPEVTILLALAIALIIVGCVVTYAVAKTQAEKD